MSSRRGLLVQRPERRSTGGGGGGSGNNSSSVPLTRLAADADLPEHQPLELPLSDASLRKVSEIANRSASLRMYETHLKKSAELLREAIGSVHDTLTERKLQLEATAERRRERGRDEPGEGEMELTQVVARLTGSVAGMTTLIEKGARTTIDRQMELEDEREALKAMAARLEEQQREDRQRQQEEEDQRAAAAAGAADGSGRRRRKRKRTDGETGGENGEDEEGGDDDDDDDDDDKDEEDGGDGNEEVAASAGEAPPPTSALSLLAEERAVRAAAYAQLSSHQKYGLNNDYISFKQAWHVGMYPDNDVELPSAAYWFDAAGEPVPYGPNTDGEDEGLPHNGGGGGGDGGGGDDEELVIQREVISFKCPLSLVTMVDPYRSSVCKHAFEHSAIMEYLQSGPAATRNAPKKCPQTGCTVEFTAMDLVPDTLMRRRIQHAAKMEQRRHDAVDALDMESDGGGDGGGGSGGGPDDAQDVDDMIVDANQRRTRAESMARSVKRERFSRA